MTRVPKPKPRVSANDRSRAKSDTITEDYHTVLTELVLLTTVSVLLFGFLLARTEEWLHTGALILVASATLIFVLPVVYHRLQFPYSDWEKFQVRSHTFISLGFPLLAAGIYLCLALAIWNIFEAFSFAVGGVPVAIASLALAARRITP